MLFGNDVGSLFHGVCRHDDAVISFGVAGTISIRLETVIVSYSRGVDIAFEEHRDRHLDDGLDICTPVLYHLVHSNVLLSITSCGKLSHTTRASIAERDEEAQVGKIVKA